MKYRMSGSRVSVFCFALVALLAGVSSAKAQSCQTSSDLDDATRSAITSAAQRYYNMAAKGDTAGLRQNSISSLASSFSSIELTVKDHQAALAAAQPAVKSVFLLDAQGSAPIPHAEFFCGVFGKNGQTSGSAEFFLDNLPPAKYGVAILDAASAQARDSFSAVLQQVGSDWKLAGLYVKAGQIAGHDDQWFLTQARAYKAKGQMHNAWLFYLEARALVSPLPFMSTLASDKVIEESQALQPKDVPVNGKTADLVSGTTTYKLTDMFPEQVGNDLDLIVKYQAADVSNTNLAYQNNVAAMKALVGKYPELKQAFAGIVARGVDPSGRDYGTLLAMKEIR
jgi:hypothetical protein